MPKRLEAEKNWKSLMRGELRGLPKSYQEFETPRKTDFASRVAAAIMLPAVGLEGLVKNQVDFVLETLTDIMYQPYDPGKSSSYLLSAMGGMVGGVPGGPEMGSAAGMVRKAGKRGPGFRKLMAEEWRKRGAPVGEEDKVKGLIDYVTRGLWWHGRKTYPKAGESFAGARIKGGNMGEPWGLSLAADPQVPIGKGFAKAQGKWIRVRNKLNNKWFEERTKLRDELVGRGILDKELPEVGLEEAFRDVKSGKFGSDLVKRVERLDKLAETRTKVDLLQRAPARVFPIFGGEPSKMVLPAWKGPGTEYAQEIFKDSYVKGLREQPGIWKRDRITFISFRDLTEEAKVYIRGYNKKEVSLDKLKTLARKDPDAELALGHLVPKTQVQPRYLEENWRSLINEEQHQKFISQDLRSRGYKALLYSSERYGEYELRMLDPADVRMMDIRSPGDKALERLYKKESVSDPTLVMSDKLEIFPSGRQKKRMERWETELQGLPHSLGDIYKDIDLRALTLEGEGVPRAKPGVGEFSDLDTLDMPDFAGMGEIPEPKWVKGTADKIVKKLLKEVEI